MSVNVSIFHCLESVEFIILKKPELNPAFSSLKANFAMPDKKTTVILWNFYKGTVIIIWTCPRKRNWGVNTA